MRILPAILTPDPEGLKVMLAQVEEFTTSAQIDIMDGRFVPSKSITAQNLKEASTRLELEIHLMTLHPEEYLQPFKEAGAKRTVFHLEATQNPLKAIKEARLQSLSPGIAINPDTPLKSLYPFIEQIDFVLFLSVYPGFYGQQFIPQVLEKAREFKQLFPFKEAGIDGGVKRENILKIQAAGLDYVCVGSGLFYGNPKENYLKLVSLVSGSQQNHGHHRETPL